MEEVLRHLKNTVFMKIGAFTNHLCHISSIDFFYYFAVLAWGSAPRPPPGGLRPPGPPMKGLVQAMENLSLIFIDFFKMSTGAEIGSKSRKTSFYMFWLATPLFRCLRLTRVSQTVDIEEI